MTFSILRPFFGAIVFAPCICSAIETIFERPRPADLHLGSPQTYLDISSITLDLHTRYQDYLGFGYCSAFTVYHS